MNITQSPSPKPQAKTVKPYTKTADLKSNHLTAHRGKFSRKYLQMCNVVVEEQQPQNQLKFKAELSTVISEATRTKFEYEEA